MDLGPWDHRAVRLAALSAGSVSCGMDFAALAVGDPALEAGANALQGPACAVLTQIARRCERRARRLCGEVKRVMGLTLIAMAMA
jgi:hypothetical protein